MLFSTTAYISQGVALETETQTASWEATEICLTLSEQFGYSETVDLWGRHTGDYGDRPTALGQRVY